MTRSKHFETLIQNRLSELQRRIEEVDAELGHEMSKDLDEQAVDIEDDEVLEGLGQAAQQEVALLNLALQRIEKGTYGICPKCDEEISSERLEAVPHAVLCRDCAQSKSP